MQPKGDGHRIVQSDTNGYLEARAAKRHDRQVVTQCGGHIDSQRWRLRFAS